MKKKQKGPKIILMDLPWDLYFGRQVQHGICQYAWPDRPWVFIRIWGHTNSRWLRNTDTAGMISMRHPRDYLTDALRYDLATVGVGKWDATPQFRGLAYVDVDPVAIGEMAAKYFIERGYRNFGMIAWHKDIHSQYRVDSFVAALRRRKLSCSLFDHKKKYPPCGKPLPAVSGEAEKIRRWLTELPKPLAIFAIDDQMGAWVCPVCRRTGINVPEDVAVLGVDDDNMFCAVTYPHLSSIAVPAEQIGFEAAKMLDGLISGKKAPKKPILLPPIGVMTRQSTDIIAIDDYYVVKAVRYISEHAHEGINVESVLNQVPLSRRMLERRFRKAVGRGLFAEIRRVQIERIKMLLANTDKTLEAAADECGFKSVSRMSALIKKDIGMTPGAWRKQFRNAIERQSE